MAVYDYISAIASPVTAGLGMYMTHYENELQRQWQHEENALARKENYLWNEQAAENADTRQRAQINDYFTPKAQMQMLKEAGLSPSIAYGGGAGVQGQAVGQQGGGANGPSAVAPTIFNPVQGAQLAQTIAQTNLIKAETQKTKSETNTIQETLHPFIANLVADTQLKLASTGNQEAAAELAKAETTAKNLENEFNINTFAQKIELFGYQVKKAFEEAHNIELDNEYLESTMDSRVEQQAKMVELTINNCLLAKTQAKLNEATREKIIEETKYISKEFVLH